VRKSGFRSIRIRVSSPIRLSGAQVCSEDCAGADQQPVPELGRAALFEFVLDLVDLGLIAFLGASGHRDIAAMILGVNAARRRSHRVRQSDGATLVADSNFFMASRTDKKPNR
jgi:hypothetical protein